MYGPVVDVIVFFYPNLDRGRKRGGGGGDLNPNITFFNICANAMRLDDFFKNLSANNVMWSVNVH